MKVIDATEHDFDSFSKQAVDCLGAAKGATVVCGIATGGLHFADALAREMSRHGESPVRLDVTCQRPSSKIKKSSSRTAHNWLARLPRRIKWALRNLEHFFLAMRNSQHREITGLSAADLNNISRVVVVDDAIDSGHSMRVVVDHINSLSTHVEVKVIAFVVTRTNPACKVDYAYLRGVLVRFPWSIDYA